MPPTTVLRLFTNAMGISNWTDSRVDCVSRTLRGATRLQFVEASYRFRVCSDRSWPSSSFFSEIRCKDPDRIGVLSAQVSTHSVGGVAHYACPRGYYMEGNETRICLQNGSWSGSIPACFGEFIDSLVSGRWYNASVLVSAVDCKHPEAIENGRVIVVNGSTTYGGAAEYHCLPQFERIGPFLRKCLETGLWSGQEPSCESKSRFHYLMSIFFEACLIVSIRRSGVEWSRRSPGRRNQRWYRCWCNPLHSPDTWTDLSAIVSAIDEYSLFSSIQCSDMIEILFFLRRRKATPVKNTENVQAAERKEDQNAAVMSYASLNDGIPNTMYENVPEEGLYDSPYSISGSM